MNVKETGIKLNKNAISLTIKNSAEKIDEKLSGLKLPSFFKKSRFLAPLILVVITISVITFSISSTESNIPTFKVKRDNFLVSITESGELRAKNSISIPSPMLRSTLKIVYLIPEGTYVKAGDVVVKFDPTEALNSLKEAEANLEIILSEREKLVANQKSAQAQTESDLKNAELSFELSKLNLEQIKFEAQIKQQEAQLQHKKNELTYERTKQDAVSKDIIRRAELNKMEIEVQQKRAELEKARRSLDMLSLTAPAEGLVVYEVNWANSGRKFNVGDQISWGGMPIISLPDLSAMESITYVNEVDVSKVKAGQKVKITLDAFRDSTFDAVIEKVARLGRIKNNNSNIKVFEISVQVNSRSDILKPGMTTSNKIIINEISGVFYIPQEAVFEKEGNNIVYVKNASGFDEQKVEVGEKSENYIIVTKGLAEGTEVALLDPTIDTHNPEFQSQNDSFSIPASAR